ncbi:MAG: hypothetical protein RIS97_1154, partial [Pseudomonadota bacterium]
ARNTANAEQGDERDWDDPYTQAALGESAIKQGFQRSGNQRFCTGGNGHS